MIKFATRSLCLAALLLCSALVACSDDPKVNQPNVLLVVVDTLRADHLTPYGYTMNPTTPELQKLVDAEGLEVLPGLVAASSWTKPSMATLFTGLAPSQHGVMRLIGKNSKLKDMHTLAAEFKAAGYDTGCVMSNFLLTKRTKTGYDYGFDFYDDSTGTKQDPHRDSTAQVVTDSGLQWLSERDPDKPWLLVLHYFDPHASFEDHANVDWLDPGYQGWVTGGASTDTLREHEANCSSADRAALAAFYDEEIHAVDHQIGRAVEHLKSSQQWADTVLMFTADHGEELGERGHIGHTQTLFPELVDIPLMVRVPQPWKSAWDLPEAAGGGYQMTQLYPALMGVAGIELPAGRSASAPAYVAVEVDFEPVRKEHVEKYVQKRLVRDGSFTLIRDLRSGSEQLFDHAADPQMLAPLSDQHPKLQKLQALLDTHDWWEAP
ncbi:MAG: sulfatase [Planctomycetes bacterium]|nr:sulfatase [Planctomycetota bacterium]